MAFQAIMTGDWHISNNLPYAKKDPETLISDRLTDVIAVVDWIFNTARERDVPVFILGDLFDQKRPDSVSLKTVIRLLRSACESGVDVYILPGNHEAPNERGLHYVVDALSEAGINGLTILEAGHVLNWEGVNICPVPYRAKTETMGLIDSYRGIQEPKVLLLHDTIIGIKNRGWVAEEGISVEDVVDFSIVFSGHIHEKQNVYSSDKRRWAAIYPGAPYQLDFGDAGLNPIINMLTVRGPKSIEIESIEAPSELSWHFFQGEWDGSKLVSKGYEESSRYFRLIFKGTDNELRKNRPEIDGILERWKSLTDTRKANFIHRQVGGAGESRLEVDTIGGLPPMENLLSQFVDLFERDDRKALINAGMEALRNGD